MDLRRFFRGRVSLLCLGNELNGDDALGYHVAERLAGLDGGGLQVIYASTVPENFIEAIIDFRPERVVVLDAGDFGGRPGEVRVLDLRGLEGFHVSTHRMPIRLFGRRFEEAGVKVVFLGVQLKQAGIGEFLSPEVAEAVERLCKEITAARGF